MKSNLNPKNAVVPLNSVYFISPNAFGALPTSPFLPFPFQENGKNGEKTAVFRLNSASGSRRCFSMPELLISMAVMIALLLFLVKMIDVVTKSFKQSSQLMDATSRARFVMERINSDFSHMPKRMDIGYRFTNAPLGEDYLKFLSQVKGPGGERNLSLIGYRLLKGADGSYGIYRGAHGYRWRDIGFMGLDDQGRPPNLLNLGAGLDIEENDYDLLAPGVCRIALSFQYKNDGKLYNQPPLVQMGTNQGPLSIQVTNLATIVLGIVMVDLKNTERMTSGQYDLLLSKFTEVPEGVTPLAHWNTNLQSRFSEFSQGLPKTVAQSVWLFQRFYPLD